MTEAKSTHIVINEQLEQPVWWGSGEYAQLMADRLKELTGIDHRVEAAKEQP